MSFSHPASPALSALEECSEAVILARYRARYRTQDALFALLDRVLRILVRPRRPHKIPEHPRRILLVNAGHLGDTVISTALVPVLKHAFPEAALGFLTGSHSRAVIEGHPLLERTHFLDHWYVSRSQASWVARLLEYYLRGFPAMVRELKEEHYDVALDLRAWFPNFVPLLWRAEIPVRIGFARVGFGPLLTHAHTYAYDRRHEVDHQLDLLRLWGVLDKSLALARPVLAPVREDSRRRVDALLDGAGRYVVLHPASSTRVKDWTLEGWTTLACNLLAGGVTPVITGVGTRDAAIAKAISQAAPGTVNTVDHLRWEELMAVLARAEVVYSVDTSIGHAAAALGRPLVVLYGGMADPAHWAPLGSQVVTKPQPCSPCFKKQGCSHRSCLLQITVQDVQAAARLETETSSSNS